MDVESADGRIAVRWPAHDAWDELRQTGLPIVSLPIKGATTAEQAVRSVGDRVSCVPNSTHPYFRESALAALIDLGGSFDAKLHPFIQRKWSELSPADKQVAWRGH